MTVWHEGMIVGFTGTRAGMSEGQESHIRGMLGVLEPKYVVHGDCVGADAQFHSICQELNIEIHIRPSTLSTRAYCSDAKVVHDQKSPLIRNHDIVDEADVVLATPRGNKEEIRSGTWATVRYARGKKILRVYYPNGIISER